MLSQNVESSSAVVVFPMSLLTNTSNASFRTLFRVTVQSVGLGGELRDAVQGLGMRDWGLEFGAELRGAGV